MSSSKSAVGIRHHLAIAVVAGASGAAAESNKREQMVAVGQQTDCPLVVGIGALVRRTDEGVWG